MDSPYTSPELAQAAQSARTEAEVRAKRSPLPALYYINEWLVTVDFTPSERRISLEIFTTLESARENAEESPISIPYEGGKRKHFTYRRTILASQSDVVDLSPSESELRAREENERDEDALVRQNRSPYVTGRI